jgi:hypothetical protein
MLPKRLDALQHCGLDAELAFGPSRHRYVAAQWQHSPAADIIGVRRRDDPMSLIV